MKHITEQYRRTFNVPLESTEVISSLSALDTEIPKQIRYIGQRFYSQQEKRFYWFKSVTNNEWTYDMLKVFGKTVNCITWNITGTTTFNNVDYEYINYEGLIDFIQDNFLDMIDEDFGTQDALNGITIKVLPINLDLTITMLSSDNFSIEMNRGAQHVFFHYMDLNSDMWGAEIESFLNESDAFALPINADIAYDIAIVQNEVIDSESINNSRQFRTNYDYIVDYLCDITSVGSDFKYIGGRLYRDVANTYISDGSDNTRSSLVPISMNYDLQPVLVKKDLEISDYYTHPEQQALPFGAKETKNALSVSSSIDQAVVDCMLIRQDAFGHFDTVHLDFINNGGTLYIKSRYAMTNANILVLYKRTPMSGINIDATYPSQESDKQNIIPAITEAVENGRREY